MGGGGSKPSAPPPPPPPAPYVPDAPKKFKRGSPPASLELKIAKSARCDGCVFGIDVGVSSSMVILSRDVLGKIAVPVVPVSDKWVWDDRVGFGEDGVPKLLQTSSDLSRDCDGVGCKYVRADPSSWGTKWGDYTIDSKGNAGPDTKMNAAGIQKMFDLDLTAWRADHQIAKLRKTGGKKVRMWNPSDDPDDAGGSQAINYANYGALTKLFLKPTLPFNLTFAPASASISLMSVYQPFPLRVDSFAESGKQYDACFQIGEFRSDNITGTSIVILVPLKVAPNPGVGGTFVNAFASKIPNILGQQPDPLLGYPDVPAQTGANWDVSKVVDTTRPYYSWKNSDGTRVIVMAEPILISEGDMGNIQRLPVTPPEDVIHELPSFIQYKEAPPVDVNGNPVPCKNDVIAALSSKVVQPPVAANKPAVSTDLWLQTILGIVGVIAIIIGVWFGVKLASGPVGEMLKKLGDSLGSSLAGGYGAMKRARSGTANVLGIGQNRPVPPPRTPAQIAVAPPPPDTPAAIADLPEPSGTFQMTNPGYSSLNDFAARQRTMRNSPVRRNSRRMTIRSPAQVAATPPPPETPAAVANLPTPPTVANLPTPEPASFQMTNPGYTSLNDFAARHRTRRNTVRLRTPTALGDISPAFIPEPTGDFAMKNPGYKDKADFARRHTRRTRGVSVTSPDFGKTLQRIRDSAPPTVASVVHATEPFPDAPHIRGVVPPPLPSVAEVARATEPFPDATVPPPAPAPAPAAPARKRRVIAPEPEETPEERIQRRAEETALPRRLGMPTGPRRTGTDTGLFGSPAARGALGVREREDRTPGQNATIFGGKKRRHRMKTGRRV